MNRSRNAIMEANETPLSTYIERLNGLMSWWGMPGPTGNTLLDHQMRRLQRFAADFQKSCTDAYCSEMEALVGGNERLSRSMLGLLQHRRPPEGGAVESEILAILLEGASHQTKRWADLTQKLQECCSAVTREVAIDLQQQIQDWPTKGVVASDQQPAKTALRRTAQVSSGPTS